MFTASLPAIISPTERRCSLLALEQNGGRLATFYFTQEVCAPVEVLEAAQVSTGTLVTAATPLHFKETDRQSYTHTYTHEREKERVFGNLPSEFLRLFQGT